MSRTIERTSSKDSSLVMSYTNKTPYEILKLNDLHNYIVPQVFLYYLFIFYSGPNGTPILPYL